MPATFPTVLRVASPMFVGHLAAALGAKKAEPRVPLGAAVAAAWALDLVWPILLLLGVETARVEPGNTAFTSLAFTSYPWSHSLLMAVAWSLAGAALARAVYGSWRVGWVLGALVFSHWILDFVVHRPDLPLWPGGPAVGMGLWHSIPGTIVVEGALLAAGLWLYGRATRPRDRVGRWALVGLVAVTTLIWITQPWAPPPPSMRAVALTGLALWLFVLWGGWIERHRDVREGAPT